MPIKFTKPLAGAPASAPANPPAASHTAPGGAANPTVSGGSAGVVNLPKPPPASHLITGAQQRSQVDQIKAQQQLRERLRGGAMSFYLEPGQFARLYFLDGQLLPDNTFDTPMVVTHMLQIGGDWVTLVCNQHTEEKCVICDSNMDRSKPNTFQLFTVINTTPYTVKNGKNKGKVLLARLQLLSATVKIREKLAMKAQAKGGRLAGRMFQFSRASNQDSRTGDDIEYMQDIDMAGVLAKYPKLGPNDTATGIIDYGSAYPILTNSELAILRPDIAHAAGYATPTFVAPGQQSSSVGPIPDDEIPF